MALPSVPDGVAAGKRDGSKCRRRRIQERHAVVGRRPASCNRSTTDRHDVDERRNVTFTAGATVHRRRRRKIAHPAAATPSPPTTHGNTLDDDSG
jgi:hypothetical protein